MKEEISSPSSLDEQQNNELLRSLGIPSNSKTHLYLRNLQREYEARDSKLTESKNKQAPTLSMTKTLRRNNVALQLLSSESDSVVTNKAVNVPAEDETFIKLCHRFLFPLNLKQKGAVVGENEIAPCKQYLSAQSTTSDWFFYRELVDQLRKTVDITPELIKQYLRQFLDHLHSTELPDQTTIAACITKADLHQSEETLNSDLVAQILGNLLEHFQSKLRNRILKSAANCKELNFNLSSFTKSLKSRRYTRRRTLKTDTSDFQLGDQILQPRGRHLSLCASRKGSVPGQLKDSLFTRHSCYSFGTNGLQELDSIQQNRVFVVLDLLTVLQQQNRRSNVFYSTTFPLLIFAMRFIIHQFFSSCHPTVTNLPQWNKLLEEVDREFMNLIDPHGVYSKLAPLQSSIKGASMCNAILRKAHPPLRFNFRDLSIPLRAAFSSKSKMDYAIFQTLDSDDKQALLKRAQCRLHLRKC